MKWKPNEKTPVQSSRLDWMTYVLGRLESVFVQTILDTSVFSQKERDDVIKKYRDLRQICVDGSARAKSVQPSCRTVTEEVSSSDFDLDDTELLVKYDRTINELLYFVSLSLSILERLYLTNRMTETIYLKYKRVLRFLPNLHHRLGYLMKTRQIE